MLSAWSVWKNTGIVVVFVALKKGLPGKFAHVSYCRIKLAFLLAVHVSESGQSLLILVCLPSQWRLSGGIVFRESCSLDRAEDIEQTVT